jgi:ribonuclease P protein component
MTNINTTKFVIIKKRNDILKTKKFTSQVRNAYFCIKYSICDCSCVLVVNTKKNCKSSVKRNKLKRRIKEILNTTHFCYSIVIYSYTLSFNDTFVHIKKALQDLLLDINHKLFI